MPQKSLSFCLPTLEERVVSHGMDHYRYYDCLFEVNKTVWLNRGRKEGPRSPIRSYCTPPSTLSTSLTCKLQNCPPSIRPWRASQQEATHHNWIQRSTSCSTYSILFLARLRPAKLQNCASIRSNHVAGSPYRNRTLRGKGWIWTGGGCLSMPRLWSKN